VYAKAEIPYRLTGIIGFTRLVESSADCLRVSLVLGDWFDLQGPWSGIDVQETLLFFASQYACFKALPALLPGKIY